MNVLEIKDNEFENIIKNTKGIVLVDCYADWCGPCKMMQPIIDELAREITTCKFFKINVDDAEQTSEKYNIMSIPTLLLFKDGKLETQLVGLKSKDELINIINNI